MQNTYIWISELLWWTGSFILAVAIILPFYPELIVEVPFLVPNIILVILMVQCFRLTFFLRQSPLPQMPWIIFALTFAFIPVCLYAIKHYSEMSDFFENSNWVHSFSYLLTLTEKSKLAAYIRTEFTWIAVMAFISGLTFSGRMIGASWRILNKRSKI